MKQLLRALVAAGWLLVALPTEVALAQKPSGTLKMYDPDSPASMSIHEEATIVSERPMMGVFNNLVMFDQHAPDSKVAEWASRKKLSAERASGVGFRRTVQAGEPKTVQGDESRCADAHRLFVPGEQA